ncbi:MAG: DUF6095 family protein [Tenacibaculum sp.]
MNKKKLAEKSLKFTLVLLILLIMSPLTLSLAFRALKAYKATCKAPVAYSVLALGILLTLYTVYHGVKTIKTFLNFIFKD